MELSRKQKTFADAYLSNGGNASEAARTAGYSLKNVGANAAKTLKTPKVQEYIQERLKPIEQRADVDVEDAITHLLDIAMGREVTARSSKYDNLKGEKVKDATVTYVPAPKQQIEALELYLKYKGALRNASKELETQKVAKTKADTRKTEAEADIAEVKAKRESGGGEAGAISVNVVLPDQKQDEEAGNEQRNN